MADFARDNKGLKTTFPVSGIALHEPAFLSDTVQLTHPLFGPMARVGMRERKWVNIAGGAGITAVNLSATVGGSAATPAFPGPVPDNTVRVIEFLSARHDDPVTRQAQVLAFNTKIPGSILVVAHTLFESTAAGVPQAQGWPLQRKLFLGPDDEVQISIGIAAGMAITVTYAFTDYSAADVAL